MTRSQFDSHVYPCLHDCTGDLQLSSGEGSHDLHLKVHKAVSRSTV
jgi:hypothetical protein